MPNCYRCKQPIFFLSERPEYKILGGYLKPKEIRTEPKPIPINVNPDPAGNIAIYETKDQYCGVGPGTWIRRLYHEALKIWRERGGVVYSSHFDTCPERR